MASEKIDPVGDEFYKPLLRADMVFHWFFYVSAALSLIALLVGEKTHPAAHEVVQITFALSVVTLFCTGLTIRLYFFPRAQVRRYQDFLSHAFGKPLSHKQTVAYYNNSAKTTTARVAAQVLESSFFSKDTLSQMVARERIKVVFYALLWLVIILYRRTDLAVIGVVAQIVFSEQIISRWIRLEWFRWQCEKTYSQLFTLFQSKAKLEIPAWESLGRYEIAKATSCISLSTSIFERSSQRMNKEWDEIRSTLSI
jgi:hypothetical protein